jgi:hypothetical protein
MPFITHFRLLGASNEKALTSKCIRSSGFNSLQSGLTGAGNTAYRLFLAVCAFFKKSPCLNIFPNEVLDVVGEGTVLLSSGLNGK